MAVHRALAVLALTAGLLALPSTARAEEDWYGYQVLAVDAVAGGLLIATFETETYELIMPTIALGFFGAPVVHAVHENYGRMGISVGMRLGGVSVGMIAGALIGSSRRRGLKSIGGMFRGAATGMLAGYIVAAIVDIAFVAREDNDELAAPRMFTLGGRF